MEGGAEQVDVRFESEALALEGDLGVAHWQASWRRPLDGARVLVDGVLVVRFDEAGRCREHREWYAMADDA